jgi:predicted O-methyltransferase YrrM
MLNTLIEIFDRNKIQINDSGDVTDLHSHTSMQQGLFIQEMFNLINPLNTIEVGFAYGISAMFILEMHKKLNIPNSKHLVIEPDDYWGEAAIYNIRKEKLEKYLTVFNEISDRVLPKLYLENRKFQFAYIDTTKRFDTVFQDFYFIDRMLEINGIIIFDDCGGGWPGVQRVVRYVSTLDNYVLIGKYGKIKMSRKKYVLHAILSSILKLIPYKEKIYPTYNFISDFQLGLNYYCLAFQKVSMDKRSWDYDKTF